MSKESKKFNEKAKRSVSSRPPLIFQPPYQFHFKRENSFPHLQENRDFLSCAACLKAVDRRRRRQTDDRPHSSNVHQRPTATSSSEQQIPAKRNIKPFSPPTNADLERLSRPKTVPIEEHSNNCNWSNFIQKKSRYAIRTPYAQCDLSNDQENHENRPPFINYGSKYQDKQTGEKRTFNSVAIHHMKHHDIQDQKLIDMMRERRLQIQAQNYFREIEEQKAYAQELQDRAARSSTEYRDNFRAPQENYGQRTYARH